MTISFAEKYESRKVTRSNTGSSAEFVFTFTGIDDENAIRNAAATSTPTTYQDLSRGEISVSPVHVDTENPDNCIWDVTVKYVPPTAPTAEGDPSTFSFDTGGGTQHIIVGKSVVAAYGAWANADDFGGLIGATKDNVEGVDITVPTYQFSETHYLDDATVTDAYKGKLYTLTGTVNNALFKGCAIGECLFLGASGSHRGGEKWEITFKFAASPNKTGLTVGTITGVSKKGWEYMWVRYVPKLLSGGQDIGQKPVGVYVHKVYEDGDFSLLGIGA